MAVRYNSPPNWPKPPEGWVPPQGWQSDPAWGPAPPGWNFWVDENGNPAPPPQPSQQGAAPTGPAAQPPKEKNWFARHKVLTALGAILALIVVIVALAGGGGSQLAEPPTSSETTPSPNPEPTTTSPPSPPTTTAPKPTTAKPTKAETTEPTESAAPKPVNYSGRGNKILRIKKPSDGPNLITLTHSGEANFIVDQLDAELQEDENLVNAIGNYEGTTILDIYDEANTKRLKIQADGRWTIKIANLTDARRFGSSAKGRGDDVLLYDGGTGVATLTHSGESNFIVDFYNEDGEENLVNEIGRYSGESVIGSGPGVVKISADGRWTIKIEE